MIVPCFWSLLEDAISIYMGGRKRLQEDEVIPLNPFRVLFKLACNIVEFAINLRGEMIVYRIIEYICWVKGFEAFMENE